MRQRAGGGEHKNPRLGINVTRAVTVDHMILNNCECETIQ